ncbi:BQ5605_C028g10518 [Microbotryum silenes-dioicae]|uniref:BQ5605_C028g10518 protein n=1 Tax=Microbotryum silenes-dioicae TaxID=796604 RepID=A0A2X0PIV4_9BASI|nr:BQ5605_C028g10518 [Microbotryum silenes-dioicae]
MSAYPNQQPGYNNQCEYLNAVVPCARYGVDRFDAQGPHDDRNAPEISSSKTSQPHCRWGVGVGNEESFFPVADEEPQSDRRRVTRTPESIMPSLIGADRTRALTSNFG